MATRTLDYRPRLDERSRNYRITAANPALLDVSRFWTPGTVITDQGREGACVGHGIVNEAMASPVRVKSFVNGLSAIGVFHEANRTAYDVYRRAQQIDEFEGEQYDGTSVLAGMKVGRERGWWSGYRWAFNMLELRAALEDGPVVIGVEWREGMYEAPDGWLEPTGDVVGGHCLLVTGYTRRHTRSRRPAYRLRNSWGNQFGHNGSAYIDPDALHRILFRAGGEAAVPIGRAL